MAVALIRFKDRRLEERAFLSLYGLNSWTGEVIYSPAQISRYIE